MLGLRSKCLPSVFPIGHLIHVWDYDVYIPAQAICSWGWQGGFDIPCPAWSYNTTLLLHTIFCPSGGKWPDNAAPSGCDGRALWPNDRHILVVCNSGLVFLGSFPLPTRMAGIRGGFVDLT